MTMIACPECGTRISDKASTCPYCGYAGDEPSLPIGVQSVERKVIPGPGMQLEYWNPRSVSESGKRVELPARAQRYLMDWIGGLKDWKTLQAVAPAMVGFVKDFIGPGKDFLVADLSAEIMKMVRDDSLHFGIDSDGRILPWLRDDQGINQMVRLHTEHLSPDMAGAWCHLQTQVTLAIMLDEIRDLKNQIKDIQVGLRNDRIASAEAAWDKLMQASAVTDSRLRNAMVTHAISTAIDSRRRLMRDYEQKADYLIEQSNTMPKGSFLYRIAHFREALKGPEQVHAVALEAYEDLVLIVDDLRVECQGYALLGQDDAANECLNQFTEFITANSLDDEDTLYVINGALPSYAKMPELADRFTSLLRHASLSREILSSNCGTKQSNITRREDTDEEHK